MGGGFEIEQKLMSTLRRVWNAVQGIKEKSTEVREIRPVNDAIQSWLPHLNWINSYTASRRPNLGKLTGQENGNIEGQAQMMLCLLALQSSLAQSVFQVYSKTVFQGGRKSPQSPTPFQESGLPSWGGGPLKGISLNWLTLMPPELSKRHWNLGAEAEATPGK